MSKKFREITWNRDAYADLFIFRELSCLRHVENKKGRKRDGTYYAVEFVVAIEERY